MIKTKRLLSSVFALVFSTTSLFLAPISDTTAMAASGDKTRYEAEDSIIPTGSNITIKSESGTSGPNEKYISFSNQTGEQRNSIAVFPKALNIQKPGVYKISLGYKTNNGDYKKQIVKAIDPMSTYEVDTVNKVLKNEKVIQQQTVEFQSRVWTEKETTFSFDKAGLYDLEVQGDWAFMDLDYIDIYKDSVVVNPEVDFMHFNFYKDNPEDLNLKYDNHYNKFMGLLVNGSNMNKNLYTIDEANKKVSIKNEFFLNSTVSNGNIAIHFDGGEDPQLTFNILSKAERKNVYQVEAATILSGSKLLDDSSAQGRFLRMGNSGGAIFAVDVPKKGRYELHFAYRAASGDKNQDIIIKNKSGELTYGIGFPMTVDNKWGDVKQVVQLDRGFNTIAFMKQSGWM